MREHPARPRSSAALFAAGLAIVTLCLGPSLSLGQTSPSGQARAKAPHPTARTVTLRQRHPYLFYTPARIESLKKRIDRGGPTAQAWNALLDKARRLVEKDAHRLNAVPQLSLAYVVTEKPEFAALVRDTLLEVCQRDRWQGGPLLERKPPWRSGLGTAHKLRRAAIGYDSIYSFLSEEQRQTIAEGMVELGIRPTLEDWVDGRRRIHSLDSMGHNWWSSCVFMAGLASMAVAEEVPQARAWLGRINEASAEWAYYAGSHLETKPDTFGDTGAFYESVGYAGYGTSQYLLFRLAWQNAVKNPDPAAIPFIEGIGDYFINVCYPNDGRLMGLTFGDAGVHSTGSRSVGLLWGLGYQKPRFLWYLKQAGVNRQDPLTLLYYPTPAQLDDAPSAPDIPPSHLYEDIGWATLRSSWQDDATLLAVKSGFTWNHSHADNNSFLLFHKGEYLLIDSGKSGYRHETYDDYYRQSRAHNVVLFNGQGQPPEDTFRGSQLPGRVQNLIDAGRVKYVWADATGPMAHLLDRNFRHFLWIGDVILIIDDVRAHTVGRFQWLLHHGGKAKRQGLDLRVRRNDVPIDVRPLFPEPFPNTGFEHDFPGKMNLQQKTGLEHGDPDTERPYHAFVPAKKMRQTKFITAVLLNPEDEPTPTIERLETPHMRGVKIQQNGKVTKVFLNLRADGRRRHLNSNLTVQGWETDAYLTAITFPEGSDTTDPDAASRYFVADGSYLRRGETVLLDSLSNVFATWHQRDGRLNMKLQGQPVINTYLRAAQTPEALSLNGQKTDLDYDAKRDLVRIHLDQRAESQ